MKVDKMGDQVRLESRLCNCRGTAQYRAQYNYQIKDALVMSSVLLAQNLV